jgi:hypothetical protein
MKILIILGLVFTFAATSIAEPRSDWWPEDEDIIGLFADEYADRADTDIIPYVLVDVHLLAILTPSFDSGITYARFRLENLPSNDGYPTGQIAMEFTSDLTEGDIRSDFSITWTEAQGAGNYIAHIGTLEFLMFDINWIGPDHMISVRRGLDCDCLYTINGNGQAHGGIGCSFFFNCTNPEDCAFGYSPCWDGEPVAVEESSWSLVKSLF